MAPRFLAAQERGAAALGEAVEGLGVTTRVLMIGAHPDDEDTQLITWLARGRHVETAYLSLTRGDGGQNLIGNELGAGLGMIRTEELLAARRIDGGRQYFTRAFDFGFSKTADETLKHWARDSVLRDVISIIRAYRPQVIVSVWSGTPRDGHGHHQVAGILAREAFDLAGDTVRYPRAVTNGLGAWTPLKFYRASRFNPAGATLAMNVGEYDPLAGKTYAELASDSRSQHRSQGQGSLEPRGSRMDYVHLEAVHAPLAMPAPAAQEQSMFDGVGTGIERLAGVRVASVARAALDSMPAALHDVAQHESLLRPWTMVPGLARYVALLERARAGVGCMSGTAEAPVPMCDGAMGDLATTLDEQLRRATRALVLASGLEVEATVPRELVAANDSVPVTVAVYNQGHAPVAYLGRDWQAGATADRPVPVDSAVQDQFTWRPTAVSQSWWLVNPRQGDMFRLRPASDVSGRPVAQMLVGEDRVYGSSVQVGLEVAGVRFATTVEPIVHRVGDPARGEVRRPVAVVPAITVLLDHDVEYARANAPLDREIRVHVQSSASADRAAEVRLTLPEGLRTDSAVRRLALRPGASVDLSFRVRGTLRAGAHGISVVAVSNGETFTQGFTPIEYEHIRPLELYRTAAMTVQAVDVSYPAGMSIAYIPGVGDNVEPMLEQLGLRVTTLDAAALAHADLSRYSAVVVGTRAFGANEALVANNARLLQYARAGGTLVEQYGQYEMTQPGIMPYPVTLARPADRVTEEDAAVEVLDASSPLLNAPNRIGAADFDGWVQERSLYMPRTFDPRYHTLLSMHDTGEAPNDAAILVAAVGKGTYIYTTLSFFRQLPAGNPGAARLFVNLLAATPRAAATAPREPLKP